VQTALLHDLLGSLTKQLNDFETSLSLYVMQWALLPWIVIILQTPCLPRGCWISLIHFIKALTSGFYRYLFLFLHTLVVSLHICLGFCIVLDCRYA